MLPPSALIHVITCLLLQFSSAQNQEPRIAIVGAGIGGTSSGYFLRQKFPKAHIAIIEANEAHSGGRLETVKVDGREYEIGGSIIHSANKLMVDYMDICKQFGIKKKQPTPDAPFSLHRDGEIVFQEWGYPLLDKARIGLRYGIESALKLEYFVDNLLESFTGIYQKIESGSKVYNTVTEMLRDMGPVTRDNEASEEMVALTKITLREKLLSIGVDALLVDELVTVATRVNYGQMPDSLHAFVGSVGLAGMDGSLWAVEGGNKMVTVCASMLTRAKMYRGAVTKITRAGPAFSVRMEHEGSPDTVETYDIVVIAAPLTSDTGANISLPADLKAEFPGQYHTTVATIIQGELVPSAIGFKDGASFTTTNFFLSDSSNIVSIAQLTPVDYTPGTDDSLPPVFKIFSKKELSQDVISKMFRNIKFTHVKPWLAYPEYTTHDDLTSFQLAPGLFYLNRMEWAASAMEMSVISARNIANLAERHVTGARDFRVEL